MKKLTCNICLLSAILLLAINSYAKESTSKHLANNHSIQLIENKGQVRDQYGRERKDIDVKATAGGVTLFVGNGQLHYQWEKASPNLPESSSGQAPEGVETGYKFKNFTSPSERPGEVSTYRMDVTLVGANKLAVPVFEESTGYKEHYYKEYTGEEGLHVQGYNRLRYKNIWPGIDWVVYSPHQSSPQRGEVATGLKYDFIVHPGGNPADIRLRYEGATELKLDYGALIAITPFGSITESVPYSYVAETKEEVASVYVLQDNELSFAIAQPEQGTLVIDPALNWGTYFGGNGSDAIFAVAVDTSGNAIICGETTSSSNIATTGAHQTSYVDSTDCLVAKFDTSGALLWSTYYGGANLDRCLDVITDISGNIFFTGETKSDTGIATSGSFQPGISNPPGDTIQTVSNACLVKLDTGGKRVWGTYFSDTAGGNGWSITCDAAGYVYIGGATASSQGLATTGAFQTSSSSSSTRSKGFIAKFSNSGSRIWSTYYNGSVGDMYCRDSNLYIAGWTNDTANVATSGAFETTCSLCGPFGGSPGFFARFDTSGNRYWGSYYKASSIINSIVADSKGDIYIAGLPTAFATGIATSGAYQTTPAKTYLAKFSATGSRLWATYYGGSKKDYVAGLAIDERGNVFLAGDAESSSNVATSNGYKTSISGTIDAFMAIFSPAGMLEYGTYYGGASGDGIGGSAYEERGALAYGRGKIYFGGSTSSSSGIATPGAYHTSITGANDAFLVQFDADTLVYLHYPFTDTGLCVGDTLKLKYGVEQLFRSNNTFKVQLSNSGGSFSNPTVIGSASVNTAGVINCVIPNVSQGNGYRVRIVATAPADTSDDDLHDIRIYPHPANFSSSVSSPICTGDSLHLNSGSSTSGIVFSWSGPGGFSSGAEDTVITPVALADSGVYYVWANNNGCILRDTLHVTVHQTPQQVTTTGSMGTVCTGDTLKLMANSSTPGVSYAWKGPNTYHTKNVAVPHAQLSDSGKYTVTVSLGSCSDSADVTVSVDQSATVGMVPLSGKDVCAGAQAQFTSFVKNGGSNPQITWLLNGQPIAGATGVSYNTSSLANGDQLSVRVTPNTTCNSPRTSNVVTMHVTALETPSVTITASPTGSLFPNQPITFTAIPNNAGNNPGFQWKRNGKDVGGATGVTWGANANFLDNGDSICVLIRSDAPCPSPDTALSNCIELEIRLGVDDVQQGKVRVYPNPTDNILHIGGITPGTAIELYDVIGRKVHSSITHAQETSIDMQGLPVGNYLLLLTHQDGTRMRYKVVKE